MCRKSDVADMESHEQRKQLCRVHVYHPDTSTTRPTGHKTWRVSILSTISVQEFSPPPTICHVTLKKHSEMQVGLNVKFTPEQATKAHRGSRCIALFFL